ncbi:MAG: response regulator [Balneola sp.]
MNRIILLEDDTLLAVVQKKMLRTLGYDVIGVSASGEEGLDKIKSLKPDIIVSDQNLMGSMTGLDVVEALRDDDDNTPVLILSGDTTYEHLTQASIYPNVQPLAKPVNIDDLKKILSQVKESVN